MHKNFHFITRALYNYSKNHCKSIFMYAFTGSLFTGCIKDDFDFDRIKSVEWSPELAAPLVNTSMTFRDILSKNTALNVSVDSTNFCTLLYSDTLYTLKASEILDIKDQGVKYDFSMTNSQVSVFGLQGSFSYSDEQHVSFKANSQAELDSIFFKSGMLNIDVISSFRQNASIRITIPGLERNGLSFSKLVSLDYKNVVPLKTNITLDLKGYMLDITNNGSTVNDLTILYKIQINSLGNTISTGDQLSVDGNFENLKFSSAFGYLGNQDFSVPTDTMSFNFFNSQPGMGSFSLVDPKLKLTFINSAGIPVYASIPSFTAYSGSAGNYPLNTGIPNPLPINSPSVSEIGYSLTGSFELNQSNSNLVTLISHFPDYFTYAIGMQTNPKGKQGQNFITDSSSLSLFADIELPLYGSAKDFVISDTADFHIDNIDQIESLLMRTTFTNGFPIDAAVQVYFTDENFTVLDSLIHTDIQVIKSGTVDIFSGKVMSPTIQSTDISFDLAHIQKIKGAKKIITQGRAATTDNGATHVKIYADYALGVNVGAIVKVKISD